MHLQVAMIPCDERCVLWHEWLACFESLSVCRRFDRRSLVLLVLCKVTSLHVALAKLCTLAL